MAVFTKALRINDRMYVEGYYDSENESIPKTIKQEKGSLQEFQLTEGSNMIDTATGDWKFYRESEEDYKTLCTIGG